MFKFCYNSQWVLFFLFLLDMLMILGFFPVKSWANTPESAVPTDSSILSPIKNAKIVSTQEQSPAYVPEGSNSEVDQITPVSQLVSPTIQRPAIPSAQTSSSDPTADNDDPTIGQVNSVSELSDVKPTDWAFQAFQSLVKRYGVILSYPDGTFKGNRSINRYEFAAGISAALESLNQRIGLSTGDFRRQDLDILKKLQEQFSAELAVLRGRVDNVEAKAEFLKQHQFSPTTVLTGRAQIVLGSVLAGNNVVTKQPAPRVPTLQESVSLRLTSSFNGTDALSVVLGGASITSLGQKGTGLFGTFDGRTADNANVTYPSNTVLLSGIRYRFLPTPNTQVNIYAQSDGASEIGFSIPINPYFESNSATGANGISRFSRRALVYNYGDNGGGIAVLQRLSKEFQLGLAYSTPNSNNPAANNGLFQGRYLALAQLLYTSPKKYFRVAATYVNTYSPPSTQGISGTNFGPAAGSNLVNSTVAGAGTIGNLYGVQAFYQLNPKFAINGWVSYAAHRYLKNGDGRAMDWAVGLAFPDLISQGSVGGVLVGMAPRLISLSKNVDLGAGLGKSDKDLSLHVEAFYQYKVRDNIEITPGLIWVTAPDSDASNPGSLFVWIRTLYRF
ncbi:MAG: carbohydrate porin [Stigonema ocellatum SAG 48.90 = DSM 106950]|nr:carbohydrate porin [Stigonema ocellatum SAG 48.90 = DSM 106950]